MSETKVSVPVHQHEFQALAERVAALEADTKYDDLGQSVRWLHARIDGIENGSIPIAPPEPETEPERPGRVGGYAPGNYECICHSCEAHFIGDKRAIQCLPCAQKQIAAERPEDEPTLVEAVQELRDLTKAHGLSFGDDAKSERQETAPPPASLAALKAEATGPHAALWEIIGEWRRSEAPVGAVISAVSSLLDRAYALDRAEQPRGETAPQAWHQAVRIERNVVPNHDEAASLVNALASAGLLASKPQRVTVTRRMLNVACARYYSCATTGDDSSAEVAMASALRTIPNLVIEEE